VRQDIRFALRQLRRHPGVTVVAVLALAIGIGANAAVFGLAEQVLFPPFGGRQPSRLAAIYTSGAHQVGYASSSHTDYRFYRRHSRAFSRIAAFVRVDAAWAHGAPTELPAGELVSANYFQTLGVRPARGRWFGPADREAPVAVVSWRFWRRQLHAAPIGHALTLDGRLFTMIGVAPGGFEGVQLNWGAPPDFWLPMSAEPLILRANLLNIPNARFCLMVGRLRHGVTLRRAAGEMRLLASQARRLYPVADRGRTALVLPFDQGRIWPSWRAKIQTMVWVLGIFAALVLLVACADAAHLMLARGAAREGEIGVRLALGAGRARIVRQLLTEGALLAAAGAAAGLLLAVWLGTWVSSFRTLFTVPLDLHPAALDWRVFAFAAILAAASVAAFGLLPALRAARLGVGTSLRRRTGGPASGGRRGWLRHPLSVAVVALAFLAVAGAAILLHTLHRLDAASSGFQPRRVLAVNVETYTVGWNAARRERFYRRLLRGVGATPGVRAAALAFDVPLTPVTFWRPVRRRGAGQWRAIPANRVSPGYFRTLRIALLRGRDFAAADGPTAPPVVIVNRTLARALWPHGRALGRRIWVQGQARPARVVGVVADVQQHNAWQAAQPMVYQPMAQAPPHSCHLLARTQGSALALLPAIRRRVAALDPRVPVYGARTMRRVAADAMAEPRMAASLVSLFGVMVLLLAAAGIYGVMAQWVERRMREVGVRMAVGATRGDILRLILRHGLALAVAGIVVGLGATLAMNRALASLTFGVTAASAGLLAVVAAVITAVALASCYLPARRAAAADPGQLLRWD
jgi:predicted permease